MDTLTLCEFGGNVPCAYCPFYQLCCTDYCNF